MRRNAAYTAAVNALYDAPDSLTPTDADPFLLPADSSAFFDSATDGSGAPVTQVALDLGYESVSAFSAMFRRAAGASPSYYRNRPQTG